ncbi:MAG: hypothetical protein WC414_03450 [Patescibacteria group bacterium]
MGDKFLRHLISLIVLVILIIVWTAGYFAGVRSWWPLIFGFVILYPLIFKLIDV